MTSSKSSSTVQKRGSQKQPAKAKATSSTRKATKATPTKSVPKKRSAPVKTAPSKKSASPTQKSTTRTPRKPKEEASFGAVKVTRSAFDIVMTETQDRPSDRTIYDGWATIQPAPENRNITLDPNIEFEAVLIDLVRTHREKSKGYGAEDPLRNFYLVGLQEGITPLQACNTLLGKHQAFLANRNRDPWPLDDPAVVDAYGDRAVYAIIAEALRRRSKSSRGFLQVPDVM